MTGKYETKKRNPLVVPVVLLSIAVIVLLAAVMFLLGGRSAAIPRDTTAATSTSPTELTTQAPAGPTVTEVEIYFDGDLCVPTDYITLHLPEQWSDCMRVTRAENGNSVSYTFYAQLAGREDVGLFIVHFHDGGEMVLGSLSLEGGVVSVSLTPMALPFDESWTGEEIDLVCAMQESTNYMTDILSTDPLFTNG